MKKRIMIRAGNCMIEVAILLIFLLTACGKGKTVSNADGTVPNEMQQPSQVNVGSAASNGSLGLSHADYFTITSDDYGLMTPNFYYSTDNASFWSIQADVANGIWDPNFQCIIRIDIPKAADGAMPALNRTYSIENNPQYEQFSGEFLVFNGHKSVYKKVEQGLISFTPDTTAAGTVAGVFDVTLTDYDSSIVPPPQYHLKGTFSLQIGVFGPATPLPAEVYPAAGKDTYDRLCSACHSLGSYDAAPETASDLSERGGELPRVYPGVVPEHEGISLDARAQQDLSVFLNAW